MAGAGPRSGRSQISADDRARFWAAHASGLNLAECAKIAGVHWNTAQQWVAKNKKLKIELAAAELADGKRDKLRGGTQRDKFNSIAETSNLPPMIPLGRLSDPAARGLEDFAFFREYYMGRVNSPWQVEAAAEIHRRLLTPDKEFGVINVSPGAGKSTLFHDVAAWTIAGNRRARVMFGSSSMALATLYTRQLRETLERPVPFQPRDEDIAKGIAVAAKGCLAIDYGRFKPSTSGALWRAEAFTVEQEDFGGLSNKEPTVSAYGIDSAFIGYRGELLLFDDVANTENSKESAARDRLLETWDSVAEARLEPGGALFVIGQRLGPGDLYAHCLSKITYEDVDEYDGMDAIDIPQDVEPVKTSKYFHIVYKAYYEELDTGRKSKRKDAPAWPNGPLLDPVRVSWKDLSYIKHSTPEKFATVYQQEDNVAGNYLIERVWATGGMGPDGNIYPGCIDVDRRAGYIPVGLADPVISVASVDPSATMYWGVQWWLYQPDTKLRYLIDLERTKLTAEDLLGFDTQTGTFHGLMEQWQERSVTLGRPITHWVVEVNAAQRYLLAHQFVRDWCSSRNVTIVAHTTTRNKLDENLGIEALLPVLWRTGQVRLPSMAGNWKSLALLDEMCKWTRDKKSGTDLVMAHWFAELHMPSLVAHKSPPRQWRPSWVKDGPSWFNRS